MKKKYRRLFAFWVLLAVLVAQTFSLTASADLKDNTVRVGFFAFEGYHNIDEDGVKSGYGYEYLQQMARYTGWSYDYIGYEESWSKAQDMLANGEIDILTSAQKTPEREEIFDFSDEPIGYSSTIFTIKAGNDKYTIDNFSTFDGVRVGMINGNSRNEDFDSFAKEKGFTYEAVMFENTEKLVDALQTETIDAVVTSSLRATNDEWVVSEFASSPYYVCVKKGDTQMLEKVNYAISQINSNTPGLQNELQSKYYGTDKSDKIAYTEQERNYISELVSSGKKLTVMINPDRAPLSYYENGEMSGVFGEISKRILEQTGLPYETVVVNNREEYKKLKDASAVDLCMDMRFDYNYSENLGYRQTDSYVSSNISRITKADFSGTINSIAAVNNSDIATALINKYYENAVIEFYDTGEECLEAVSTGEQDAAFLYTHVTEKLLNDDPAHKLKATLMSDFETNFCVGVSDTSNYSLFSIVNKSVKCLDSNWVDDITNNYTRISDKKYTITDFFYDYPVAASSILVAAAGLIFVVIILLVRQRVVRHDKERTKEIERLFSYVCKANESVLEVDLSTMTAKEYSLKNGELVIEARPYSTAENQDGFMYPEDYKRISAALNESHIQEMITHGLEYMFEARGKGKNGEYQWYIYTIDGIIPNQSHPCSFMLFKRNINELKIKEEKTRKALQDALEVAKDASEAKGSFMSRMSHEIRTPLNAVIGYMSLADDCLDQPKKVGDYIGKSQIAAKHLLSIINDVLDVSAIESGKMKIAYEEFDLKELLSSVSLMFYNQAKAKGIDFNVQIHDMSDEFVIGDRLRLNQVLMNLLSNSIKFTSAGGTITVDVTELEKREKQLCYKFVVQDTGIGMSKEFMNRIFSPFEQEKAATARKFGGSGLGLSITKNLVTMMHGSIDVDSTEGEGTAFTVHLIFGKSEKVHEQKELPHDFSKVRALIVDDEKRACDYMKSLLKRCKVKSDVVMSGEDAVRQIMKREGTDYEYNFCLLDWNLKGIDGVETARRIREECKKDIPIIIATAYDINEIRDAALKAGVNKLIEKPLFQSTMFDLLVNTYGKYQPLETISDEKKKTDFAGVHILLAEDNEMNMEIAVDILKKRGLVIDTARDGKEAFDKFTSSEKGRYELILMDVQMPVMDGYEATHAIRESSHPEAKTIPILAMTANAFREDVAAALSAGMNDHIAKPVNYDKLYSLLEKYLKK